MRWNSFWRRFRSLFFRETTEQDLDEELSSHLELQFQRHLAEGLSEKEARRRARIEFGAVEAVREECREVDRWRWIEAAARNMKQCLRSLAKSRVFVAVSVLILAIVIGSNLAVFSTLDALFLRPLPIEHPKELLKISLAGKNGRLFELPSNGLETLNHDPVLRGVCGFDTSLSGVEIKSTTRPIGVAGFTGDCFATLGLRLQLGRAIAPEDNRLGTAGVAVITDALWRSGYGGQRNVLGQSLKVDGQFYTIVGVTQKGFRGLLLGFPEDVMVPLLQRAARISGSDRLQTWYWVNVLARRARGVSEAQARASILAQKTQLLEETVPRHYNAAQRKDYFSQELSVTAGKNGVDYFLENRFGQPLYAISGICLALLLIACVNLVSLLLARSLNRRREVATRLALGARRTHIGTLFLLENTMLVFAGAALGVPIGLWITRSILATGNQMFGNFHLDVGFDARVATFLALLIICILAVFGVASVWQTGRLAKSSVLREAGRGVIATNNRAQKILIGAQIALTLAFVTASTLFTVSLRNMYSIDFGIDTHNLWELEPAGPPKNADLAATYRGILQDIGDLPDVQSASLADTVPFFTEDDREPVALIENSQARGEAQAREIGTTDNLFTTLGAKIIAGADFKRNDSPSGEPSVILSESLAWHFGNPRDLIGRHLRMGDQAEYQHLRIVGVASNTDMNLANPDDKKPFSIYLNLWQHRNLQGYPVLLVKTRGDTLPSAAIQRIVQYHGFEYIDRITTISSEIDTALVENRMIAYLSGAFSILALLMAAVGLFGLLSYQVSNRTGEIGIRMALGARRAQIQWLILSQVTRLLALGGVVGLALTLAIGKLIAGLLYGVGAYDVVPLLISAAVLSGAALAAAWVPVQRASSIDPVVALRHE